MNKRTKVRDLALGKEVNLYIKKYENSNFFIVRTGVLIVTLLYLIAEFLNSFHVIKTQGE